MKKFLKKSIILSFILAMAAPASSFAMNVERISGSDRYETAIKVNQKYINSANDNTAVVSNGTDFKISLFGSYLATSLRVPFYLTESNNLSENTLKDLETKNIQKILLVGGENAVSTKIEKTLSKKFKVTRIKETSKPDYKNYMVFDRDLQDNIDKHIFYKFFPNKYRGDISNGILINHLKFPDLLSAIPFVSETARRDGTYLATYQAFFPNYTDKVLLKSGWRFIIGGEHSVPEITTYDNDKLGLNKHYWNEDNPDEKDAIYTGRLAGSDRFETAIEIAKAYKPVLNKDIKTVVIINALDFPDALSSGIVATYENAAVLLTEPNKLNEDTKKYIMDNNIEKIVIVGGEKSVSKEVENELMMIK